MIRLSLSLWKDIEAFEEALVPDWCDYSEINDPLMKHLYEKKGSVLYELYRFEADEMWSFVGNKDNKQWIWLVMNTANRQIHVGGRSQETI